MRPIISSSQYNIVDDIKDLRTQVVQAVKTTSGSTIVDEDGVEHTVPDSYTFHGGKIIISDTQPGGLDSTTDVSTFWRDESVTPAVVEWWTGFEWKAFVAGQAHRGGVGLEAYAPAVLSEGQTSIVINYQPVSPGSPTKNQLWVDSDDDVLRRHNGSSFQLVSDTLFQAAVQAVLNQEDTGDTPAFKVFYNSVAPTADDVGDIWFDTDDFMRAYNWDGIQWVSYAGDIRITPDPNLPTMPPSVSPVLTVTNSAEALVVSTQPVDPTTSLTFQIALDYDAETDTGTWVNLPDMPIRSTIAAFYTTPDGTPLQLGVTYALRVIASNVVGSAAPSDAVVASLDPAKVSALVLAQITAGFALFGAISVGGSITIDPEQGIVIEHANGLVTRLTEGTSEIAASLTALGLTVIGPADIYGDTRLFGEMLLNDGIPDPTQQAVVTHSWKQVIAPDLEDAGAQGFVPSLTAGKALTIDVGKGSFIVEVDLATGAVTDAAEEHFAFEDPISLTTLGSNYYVLYRSFVLHLGESWYVKKYDSSWTELDDWSIDAPGSNPVMGNDGTNLLLGWPRTNDFRIRKYNIAGTGLSTLNHVHNFGEIIQIRSILQGTFNFGSERVIVAPRMQRDPVHFTTAGVRSTTFEFQRANGNQVAGIYWDSTNTCFRSLNSSTGVYEYSPGPSAAQNTFAQFTWTDGTDTTKASPVTASYSRPAQSWLVIEGRVAPESLQVAIYAGTSSTTCRLQATLPVDEVQTYIGALNTGSALAPTVTTFDEGSAAAGYIASVAASGSDPLTRIAGDGEFGFLGNNKWDSGYLTPTGSWLGRVRFIRIGEHVTAEGYLDRNDSVSGVLSGITIPVWARPLVSRSGSPRPGYGTAQQYRYVYNSDGTMEIQRTGTISTFMTFNDTYPAD